MTCGKPCCIAASALLLVPALVISVPATYRLIFSLQSQLITSFTVSPQITLVVPGLGNNTKIIRMEGLNLSLAEVRLDTGMKMSSVKFQHLLGVVANTLNPSSRKAEANGFLSLRSFWST